MLDFGFYNMDCMEGMKEFPDKYFDLAIVDPPYGSGFTGNGGCGGWFANYRPEVSGGWNRFGERFDRYKDPEGGVAWKGQVPNVTNSGTQGSGVSRTGGTWAAKFSKKIIEWDTAPPKEYFEELFRISRNQIIWGGNYFGLPPTRCFLIWRKTNVPQDFSMAMAEYAWTSFNGNAKVFDFSAVGKPGRFHPTQKPVELYKWILSIYAQPEDKILDTHVGSASSLIACYETGHKYVGFEIDAGYYKKAKKRLDQAEAQHNIFEYL